MFIEELQVTCLMAALYEFHLTKCAPGHTENVISVFNISELFVVLIFCPTFTDKP